MKELKIRLPLRISVGLKEKLTVLAEREHRSLNKQIEFLLEQCVRDDRKMNEREDPNRTKNERAKQK